MQGNKLMCREPLFKLMPKSYSWVCFFIFERSHGEKKHIQVRVAMSQDPHLNREAHGDKHAQTKTRTALHISSLENRRIRQSKCE